MIDDYRMQWKHYLYIVDVKKKYHGDEYITFMIALSLFSKLGAVSDFTFKVLRPAELVAFARISLKQ